MAYDIIHLAPYQPMNVRANVIDCHSIFVIWHEPILRTGPTFYTVNAFEVGSKTTISSCKTYGNYTCV